MTTTSPESAGWRGVAAERLDEVTGTTSLILRERSRRLLGSLLRPHKKALAVVLVIVLIENAARLSIPFLVKEGIDTGIPPIQRGDGSGRLMTIIAIVLAAVAIQASTRLVFLVLSGRIGQATLLELRRRVFTHFQTLTPAFHD